MSNHASTEPFTSTQTEPAAKAAPHLVAALSDHVQILASREFGGRLPGSPGEIKTIEYLSQCFAALGLQPAGDNGSWCQEVPLRKADIVEVRKSQVTIGESLMELQHRENFVLCAPTSCEELRIEGAELLFVGYGVDAPELDWDDFKGVDVTGRVLVVLINDPDFASAQPGRFGGKAMSYYGRWEYKFEEARRRGAVGALIIHEDAAAGYRWETVVTSLGFSHYGLDLGGALAGARPFLQGWLHHETAEQMLRSAGLELSTLKARAVLPEFRPVGLAKTRVVIDARIRLEAVVSHNVVARIVGRSRPDECVIYGAHWDHLGTMQQNDTHEAVYCGAVDNATALASILELAKVYAAASPPARSVYFVAFTAEEKGLLGSKYYVLRSPAVLELTAAMFNMELMGAVGPARDLSTWGNVRNGIWDVLARTAARRGRRLAEDPHLQAGYFFRSDHFPFAKVGVPAVTLTSGRDLYDGGLAAGNAAHLDYMTHRYHKPDDRWSPELDLRGIALDLEVLYEAGRDIAESSTWPQWNDKTSYQQARQLSAYRRSD